MNAIHVIVFAAAVVGLNEIMDSMYRLSKYNLASKATVMGVL